MKQQPINTIEWLNVKDLTANDYNPNVVLDQELRLLKYSLIQQGWMQPLLITGDLQIIDGFHRYWLVLNDAETYAITEGKVPCCVIDISEAERMLLTIRINRAKGNHVSFKMHEIVTALVKEHGLSIEAVCEGIGADKHEVNLLLQENVFAAKNIKEHNYSKAWIPSRKVK